jgi:hypothetical protein
VRQVTAPSSSAMACSARPYASPSARATASWSSVASLLERWGGSVAGVVMGDPLSWCASGSDQLPSRLPTIGCGRSRNCSGRRSSYPGHRGCRVVPSSRRQARAGGQADALTHLLLAAAFLPRARRTYRGRDERTTRGRLVCRMGTTGVQWANYVSADIGTVRPHDAGSDGVRVPVCISIDQSRLLIELTNPTKPATMRVGSGRGLGGVAERVRLLRGGIQVDPGRWAARMAESKRVEVGTGRSPVIRSCRRFGHQVVPSARSQSFGGCRRR